MASTPSTRHQHDGVAVWSLAARFSRHGRARPTHRSIRAHTGVNEAKLARGFKDLELEMGVNIDMCVYDDAEAVKMAA